MFTSEAVAATVAGLQVDNFSDVEQKTTVGTLMNYSKRAFHLTEFHSLSQFDIPWGIPICSVLSWINRSVSSSARKC
jgi:hypothetical protein